MNRSISKIALGATLALCSFNASAQKTYTEGVANYTISAPVGSMDTKMYFTNDSSAAVSDNGQYTLKILTDNKSSYMAILVNVPMISMKKVAVLSPTEVAQANNEIPKLTFTPTAETKEINGFNCKKVNAKYASGSNIELWVTNDIKMPSNSITQPFASAGGVPVKFVTVQQGQTVNAELKSISSEKVASGAFGIPQGYEKISFAELKVLGGQ